MFRFDFFNFFYMKITTFLVSLCFVLIGVSTNAFNKINETKLFSNVATDPVMPSLQNLQNCGSSTFNLTVQTSIILAAQSGTASNYSVNYYFTLVNANSGMNPISNPSAYTSSNNQQVIYARVINNGTTQYAVGAFSLIVNSFVMPAFTLLGPICQGDTPPVLPSTSTNGIAGTWTPSIVDSSTPGTYTYSFSPSPGQCADYLTMNVDVIPLPSVVYNFEYQECDDSVQDGITTFNLTAEVPTILGGQTGMTVNFYPSLSDATNNTNIITNPSFYNNTTPYLQTIGIRVTNASGCYRVSSMTLLVNPRPSLIGIGYSIINNSGIQTLTVDTIGSGTYGYSLDGGATQTSPIFQNISLGNHTITITDLMYGCATTINNIDINLTATPAPTGNTSQSFSQGATLVNMQVTGQNIQWYSGVNKMSSSTPLPLSTVLVNGTTYYASQKIGGYESNTRLPVTAQILLNNAQFELKGLTYAPNPVTTNLKIKSNEILDDVSVYNLLGQLVNQTKVLNSELQVDLSSLKSGNYFVKVSSGLSSSTFKIIKE